MKISVSVTDMLVLIYRYRQRYRLGEYICICIGISWTHIGPTLIQSNIKENWIESIELIYLPKRMNLQETYQNLNFKLPKIPKIHNLEPFSQTVTICSNLIPQRASESRIIAQLLVAVILILKLLGAFF
jgi:hypothetical protein